MRNIMSIKYKIELSIKAKNDLKNIIELQYI